MQERVTQDKNKSMIGKYCILLLDTQKPLRGNEDTVLELTGRLLPSPVENVVFVKLQFSARKFQFYWEKKVTLF